MHREPRYNYRGHKIYAVMLAVASSRSRPDGQSVRFAHQIMYHQADDSEAGHNQAHGNRLGAEVSRLQTNELSLTEVGRLPTGFRC